MKIVAFGASNSRKSINRALVTHAADVLAGMVPGAEAEILDLNDFEMPIYSADREEAGGIPDPAHAFYNKIGDADVLLISYAEHNGGYPAAFKNIFDWASRIGGKVYQNRPMVILSTSPGPGGAASVLATAKASAPFFGADVKADLSVASFYDKFDLEAGELSDPDLAKALRQALETLCTALSVAKAA